MGLPEPVDEETAKMMKKAKEDADVNLSPLDKEFWIKDETKQVRPVHAAHTL
jgi:hypothetical protein